MIWIHNELGNTRTKNSLILWLDGKLNFWFCIQVLVTLCVTSPISSSASQDILAQAVYSDKLELELRLDRLSSVLLRLVVLSYTLYTWNSNLMSAFFIRSLFIHAFTALTYFISSAATAFSNFQWAAVIRYRTAMLRHFEHFNSCLFPCSMLKVPVHYFTNMIKLIILIS